MAFWTYILASGRNGTLYTGMTEDIARRVWEHREGIHKGFTSRYNVDALVWYEFHEDRQSAFARERTIKTWRRQWKLELIECHNPTWRNLADDLQR